MTTDYEVDEGSVFAAIGRKDAKELVARSELLDDVGDLIEKSGLTQREVAKKLGIKQSKVSLLVNGHLSEFNTNTLLQYLAVLCEILECTPQKKALNNFVGTLEFDKPFNPKDLDKDLAKKIKI